MPSSPPLLSLFSLPLCALSLFIESCYRLARPVGLRSLLCASVATTRSLRRLSTGLACLRGKPRKLSAWSLTFLSLCRFFGAGFVNGPFLSVTTGRTHSPRSLTYGTSTPTFIHARSREWWQCSVNGNSEVNAAAIVHDGIIAHSSADRERCCTSNRT